MIARGHITDAGSTPAASTNTAALARFVYWRPGYPPPYGGATVSTGCSERAGGRRQATTESLIESTALRQLNGAPSVGLNSANTKRQLRRVRAADGRVSGCKRGPSHPGNRSDAGAFGVTADAPVQGLWAHGKRIGAITVRGSVPCAHQLAGVRRERTR